MPCTIEGVNWRQPIGKRGQRGMCCHIYNKKKENIGCKYLYNKGGLFLKISLIYFHSMAEMNSQCIWMVEMDFNFKFPPTLTILLSYLSFSLSHTLTAQTLTACLSPSLTDPPSPSVVCCCSQISEVCDVCCVYVFVLCVCVCLCMCVYIYIYMGVWDGRAVCVCSACVYIYIKSKISSAF